MRIEQDLPAYNTSINLRTECSDREKSCGLDKKKSAIFKLFHNFRCELPNIRFLADPHCFSFPTTYK